MRAGHKPSVILALLCLALGAVIYLELTVPPDEGGVARPIAPAPGPPAPADETARFVMPPVVEFAEVARRPLFDPSRRPPEPASVEKAPKPPSKPAGFTLVGVVISDGERMAILKRSRSKDYLRVVEGQTVGDWVVKSIAATRVVLRQGTVEEEIVLKDAAPKRPAKRRPSVRPRRKTKDAGRAKVRKPAAPQGNLK